MFLLKLLVAGIFLILAMFFRHTKRLELLNEEKEKKKRHPGLNPSVLPTCVHTERLKEKHHFFFDNLSMNLIEYLKCTFFGNNETIQETTQTLVLTTSGELVILSDKFSEASVSIHQDEEINPEDFVCSLWVENRRKVIAGSKTKLIPLNESIKWRRSFTHGRIHVYVTIYVLKCPYCVPDYKKEAERAQLEITQLRWNNERLETKVENIQNELTKTKRDLESKVAELNNAQVRASKLEDMKSDGERNLLWQMRIDRKLTDFHFYVENAHKNILALKSEFFADLFDADPNVFDYTIDEVSGIAVDAMLEFIYLGHGHKLEDYVDEVYLLAVKFSIPNLKKQCEDILRSKIATINAPEYLVLALQDDNLPVVDFVLRVVNENGGKRQLLGTNPILNILQRDPALYSKIVDLIRQ
ncbi:Speckle-type POZ protein-like protein [Aphelenchoides besseyi]|nr:Speckle-type POZ protein-like protein [Aphelenchoides besseyi]